jgi:hypothetical protein
MLRPASQMPADGYRADFTEIRHLDGGRADVRVESYYRGPGNWTVFHLGNKEGQWKVVEISGQAVP